MALQLATEDVEAIRERGLAAMRRRRALLFVLAALAAVGIVLEGVVAQVVLALVAVLAISNIVGITTDLREFGLDNEATRASSPPHRSGRAPP